MKALEKESVLRLRNSGAFSLKTLYIGGGTPSLLPPESIFPLGELIHRYFSFVPEAEITLEVNPADLTREKLSLYMEMGVNRLSFGLQSTGDSLLEVLGRRHKYLHFIRSLALAQEIGFSNLSADLMYGIPGQTPADWEQTLLTAVSLDLSHLSIYGLKVEEGTPFYDLQQQGELELPGDEEEREMFTRAGEILPYYGYRHYEISNYARTGRCSRHNLAYWENDEYLGLGPSSHGCIGRRRYANWPSLEKYVSLLRHGNLPEEREERISLELALREHMMLGLRLLEGVNLKAFREKYGVDLKDVFLKEIKKLEKMGLLEINEKAVKLTEEALPVADLVFMEFL